MIQVNTLTTAFGMSMGTMLPVFVLDTSIMYYCMLNPGLQQTAKQCEKLWFDTMTNTTAFTGVLLTTIVTGGIIGKWIGNEIKNLADA